MGKKHKKKRAAKQKQLSKHMTDDIAMEIARKLKKVFQTISR